MLPATIYLIARSNILHDHIASANEDRAHDKDTLYIKENQWHLAIVTVSSLAVLGYSYNTFQNVTLGLCHALLIAIGLTILEHGINLAAVGAQSSAPGFVSANGSLHRRAVKSDGFDSAIISLRDISGTITVLSAIGVLSVGNVGLDTLLYSFEYSNPASSAWNYNRRIRAIAQLLFMTFIGVGHIFLLFKTVSVNFPSLHVT